MLKRLAFAALASVLLLPAASAVAGGRRNNGNPTGGQFAQNHPRRNQVNNRAKNERSRINQGVKNGSMTKGQARKDRKQLDAIKAQEHAEVKANGGHLTKGEQRQLNREENKVSGEIYDQKH